MNHSTAQIEQVIDQVREFSSEQLVSLVERLQLLLQEKASSLDDENLPGSSVRFALLARKFAIDTGQPDIRARKDTLMDEWVEELLQENNTDAD